jgi:prepilin-type N-terminal cleavage/methylation domain-containing protein
MIASVLLYHQKQAGFTLIEMAIVLIILTLVVGGALVPLGAQIDQRKRAETQKTLDEIREALMGYALSHGVLPCPSVEAAGIPSGDKNPNLNLNCTSIPLISPPPTSPSPPSIATGYIPWKDLGVNNKDGWGNLIRYAVDTSFINSFNLSTTASITIKTRDTSGATPSLGTGIPAVVLSLGKNGYGGMSADFIAQSAVPASNLDEKQNISNSSASYFSRTPSPAGTATSLGGEFDDIVVWISPNILYNRMVAAGKLP